MSVEVIVLLEQSAEAITITDQSWHEPGLTNIDYLRWITLATEIAHRAAGKKKFRVDIYLIFKGDHLVSKYEYDFVEKLVELAREYTWGGEVFLVLDQGIFRDPNEIRSSVPLIASWLETARKSRAADVVLANVNRFNPSSPSPQILKKASDDSRSRNRDLLALVAPGLWRCWTVPKSAISRFSFGNELSSAGHPSDKNFLVAVDRKNSTTDDERNEIKRFIRKNGSGRFVLATVGIAASDLSIGIQSLADELSLRIIKFRGWLEVRFFLLRLNDLCASQVVLLPEIIQAVPVGVRPLFENADKTLPGLLVTSSFNRQQDSVLCREASRDIGKLLHAVSYRSECFIHPALRAEELPELFAKVTKLTVWWFIGHGKGIEGLQDVDGQILAPDEWLEKLADCGEGLPLVFFSACYSAEIAHAFARAGAGVAIGFDSDTLPSPCRILAIKVIKAALESHGDRNHILAAFSGGCRQLQFQGLDYIKPRAFYVID